MKKIKFLKDIIDQSNYQKAIKYCRQMATEMKKDNLFALAMYNSIREGKAKIYFYEDGTYDYKRVKK